MLECEQQLHISPFISESLFITTSMDDHDEEKRKESGKSEAKVTNNRRLRPSRGFSATAELLVLLLPQQKRRLYAMALSFCLFVRLSVTGNTYLTGTGVTGPAVVAATPSVSGRNAAGPVSHVRDILMVAGALRVSHSGCWSSVALTRWTWST